MAKFIGFLMIISTVIVYSYLKFKEYQTSREIAHLERMNRMEQTHSRYTFRLIQADVRKWNSEYRPRAKKNVNIVCKDPFIANVFISGIKGGNGS